MLNNFVISQIRTYVPIMVGGLISFLATKGFSLDAETQTGLIVLMTSLLQGAYYFIARVIERKFPSTSRYLLGSAAKPTYSKEVVEQKVI